MKKFVAVIVTYHPRSEVLQALLDSLLPQVELIVVVDNTPGNNNVELTSTLENISNPSHCALIRMRENTGIAKALNVGCEHALSCGADFILLSDQDSLPAKDMVTNLHRSYFELCSSGWRVGAVGPTFTDLHTGLVYPFQTHIPGRLFYGHKRPSDKVPHVEALTLITSGTLIPAQVLQDVGPMREDFFIDQVDIEWCHRARWKGYRLFGTGWATMFQRMGDARLRVWYLRWRHESAYRPLRIYYRLRNFVALCKIDIIDWRWKLRAAWYSLGIVYTHLFFGPEPLNTFKMLSKGIWHGVHGKMGRYHD